MAVARFAILVFRLERPSITCTGSGSARKPDGIKMPADTLYEQDFQAWLENQAEKLRARAHNEIDWDNLAEEIDSVGRSERRELRNRLVLLVHHLLKWQFQPGRRSESWRITISEQRIWIPGIIDTSPSLKDYPDTIFADAYAEGRQRAIDETGLSAKTFPATPPFSIDQMLDSRFFPGERLEDWATLRD